MEIKLDELFTLWAQWNAKTISGDDFAMAFRRAFPKETVDAWDTISGFHSRRKTGTKITESFGLKIGDRCKLSEEYFNHTRSKRGSEKRFEVIGFGKKGWDEESVRIKRLDLPSGKREYYHYSFLERY